MNLIVTILQKLNLSQSELANKLGVTEDQVSRWRHEEPIPYDYLKTLKEIAGINPKFSLNWFFFADNNNVIENWIALIQEFNEFADFPSLDIEGEPEDYADAPLEELMSLGCSVPKEPVSFDEYGRLQELDELPAFYQVLREYIAELGLMEKWLRTYLTNYDFEVLDQDLTDYIYEVESARYTFALRCIDEQLLREAGVSVTAFKELLLIKETEVSYKLNKIRNILASHKIKLHHDLQSYVKFNSYNLMEDGYPTGSEHKLH